MIGLNIKIVSQIEKKFIVNKMPGGSLDKIPKSAIAAVTAAIVVSQERRLFASIDEAIAGAVEGVETMKALSIKQPWHWGITEFDHLRSMGVLISHHQVKKELKKIATRRNWGRARKVSHKRPSPQLSRHDLELLKVQAIFNASTKRNRETIIAIGEAFLPRVGI
jgi:hypothetical protein